MPTKPAGTKTTEVTEPSSSAVEPKKPREAYSLTPTVEALDEFHREAVGNVEKVMAMLMAAFEDDNTLNREEKDQILPSLWAALKSMDDVKDVVKALKLGGMKAGLDEVEEIRVERRKAERATSGNGRVK